MLVYMKNTYLKIFPVCLNKYVHLQVALHVWVVSCDFSRAIDILVKWEQSFVGCEKSISFLPISQLDKTPPMHSSVWASSETIQYSHIDINLYPWKQPRKYRWNAFGLENLVLRFFLLCSWLLIITNVSSKPIFKYVIYWYLSYERKLFFFFFHVVIYFEQENNL